MKFTYSKLLMFALLSSCLLGRCSSGSNLEEDSERADLVLKNVTLFDSETATTTVNQSIFISDGIILDIRDASSTDDADQIIDGRNRLASPGLIDAHVHFTHQFHPTRVLQPQDRDRLGRVYLTHGVTTIAEMGQPPAWIPTLTAWEGASKTNSPDIIVVAGSLNSTHDWDSNPPSHHVLLASPEQAKAQVRAYHAEGAERLKLYWKLELPEMAAVISEADKLGMSYYGHIDNGFVSIQGAMEKGVRNFEHFFTLQRSMISPDPLIEMIAKDFPFEGPASLDEWTLSLALYHDKIEQTPELRAQFDALITTMVKEGATVSTSINMLAAAAAASPVFSGFDPKPPRFSPVIREGFIPDGVGVTAIQSVMTQVRRAHEAGLRIRIGTDARNGGKVTLAEMQLLAEAGLPIGDVLQIATRNGAEALGISDRAGRLETGRVADIVLFDNSPYDLPTNFLAGVTTIKGGVIYIPTVSPANILSDRLVEDGIVAARQWWERQPKRSLHPGEFQDAIHRLIDAGRILEARVMIDLLPGMLYGEDIVNYVSEENINRAGRQLLNQNNTEAAIAVFELAVDITPENWVAYHNLGSVYAAAEQLDKAIAAFERSITLNPENEAGRVAIEAARSNLQRD